MAAGKAVAGCTGTCTYQWNAATRHWDQVFSSCSAGCVCASPPPPPINPKGPVTAVVPCVMPKRGKMTGKGRPEIVKVYVAPGIELHVIPYDPARAAR
jgi:hypothetical protein